MKIEKNQVDKLNLELTVTVEAADYAPIKKKKLNERKRTAEFKGFRKGNVPMSLIEKVYGEQALVDAVNDLVGGVTVTVEDNFEGIDDTLIRGETVTLTAENVEHFVRARHDMVEDPTNINRMARQRVYMTGLFQGMKEAAASSSTFVLDAYNAVSGSLVTDCTIDKLNDYANRFSNYSLSEIVTPEGEAVRGEVYIEFYMDEEALQQLVIDTFYLPAED